MGGKKEYELMLEIGHKSTPLNKKLTNGYTHKWTAFVKGVDNSKIEYCIQRVVFQLHESFANPYREITEPPFQIKETGYAGFEIPIQIYFKNREKPNHLVFVHDLCLLTNKPNNSTTTEKIKFINPNKEFEKCLIKSGAQLLSVPIKKERSDSPPAKKQKSSSLIPSKDMNNKQTQMQQSLPQSQPQSQPSQTYSQQHHHQSQKSSSQQSNQTHHHHHNHHNSGSSNSGGSHQSKHQKQQQDPSHHHQQHNVAQKPKSSSFIDVFGAPILYNSNTNSKGGKEDGSHGREERARDDRIREDRMRDDHIREEHNREERIREERLREERIREERLREERIREERIKEERSKEERVKEERIRDDRGEEERIRDRIREDHHRNKDNRIKEDRYASDLQLIQTKISCLTDCDRLQKIVDIVEEAGEWNLTPKKFEFDLKRLDKKTLSRIERCLQY